MRVLRLSVAAAACTSLLACSRGEGAPHAQWVVAIGTDAPLPQFGDQLLVQVLDASGNVACDGCERLIGLGATTKWPVSFGVTLPSSTSDLGVRARLYRTAVTGADGRPSGSSLLDGLGRLPSASGVARVGLALKMACFGVLADPMFHTSCDPALGAPMAEPTLESTSASLPRPGDFDFNVDCAGTPPPGMTCIPGGAFLFGDARVDYYGVLRAYPERLVRLSPFFMDIDEFSVGAIRNLLQAGALPAAPLTPAPSGQAFDACTYLGLDDATNDALPVNCLPRALAEAACEAGGKQLPTEAQWEYATGNATREDPYPWGGDDPSCDRAIAARGPSAGEGFVEPGAATACRIEASGNVLPKGPVAGGSPRDVNSFGVKNLAGNMSEWVADAYAEYDSRCWRDGPVMLDDPHCDGPDTAPASMRGSAWVFPLFLTHAAARNEGPKATGAADGLGFRCVKAAAP